jgi:predicted transcriptional regulator
MTLKLSPEQLEAIDQSDGPVSVEDERTHRRYFLVDEARYAILQQKEDVAAIREGIEDMEAGRVAPLDEVVARIRKSLSLPQE